MAGIVGTHLVAQVGFIVKDIEETKKKWAAFLGVDVPETQPCGDYAVTQTVFEGKPAPEANSLLAFFDVGLGLQIELIQPNEAPSVWRDVLDEYGEGIHHIAFKVQGADEVARELVEAFDAVIEQQGTYSDGSGQYIYLDCFKRLKCRIELLESYKESTGKTN